MRRLMTLGIVPALIAGTLLLAPPPPATLASGGLTETGVATYQVLPDKGLIHVIVTLSEKNTKTNESCGAWCTTRFYWNKTSMAVEVGAINLSATSNAGKVGLSTRKTSTYYRYLDVSYPNVYYGQTRKITVTYDLQAGPGSPGGFRALQAYASLCMIGQGYNSGVVQAVLPSNLVVDVTMGEMPQKTTSGATQVISSGSISEPYYAYYCIDAADSSKLSSAPLTAAGQSFNLQGWPEDQNWTSAIQITLTTDAKKLTDFTGLTFPGGTLKVQETAGETKSHYSGFYEPSTQTLLVPEVANTSTVVHELSHVWFNRQLFVDMWAQEGFAQYAEAAAGLGSYEACTPPVAYPGTGTPDLIKWKYVSGSSSNEDENVADWQFDASCYVVTNLAEAMGPANFKKVLAAMAAGDNAYAGKDAGAPAKVVLTSKNILDYVDERGMVAAGIKDLAQAQDLMAKYGIFTDTAVLVDRTKARTTYHAQAALAGKWVMPAAVRNMMSGWDFAEATKAMATTQQILDLRKGILDGIPGFSLDGTTFQTKFESAATQADLDALLALMKKESDAGKVVAEAAKLSSGGQNPIAAIGLIGTDTNGPLTKAKEALAAGKFDEAAAQAKNVTNALNGATVGGLLRLGILLILVLLAAVAVFLVMRRRRAPVPALAMAEGVDATAAVPVEGAVTPPDVTTPPPAAPPADPPATS